MEKVFAFRFDIDTPKCLTQGVPPLINLAERLGVKFTFFLNVGHAISLFDVIDRKFRSNKQPGTPSAEHLSAKQKLGTFQYLFTALINPKIGANHPRIVKRIAESQELGLHGGANHDTWHHSAHSWPQQKVIDEIQWALRKLGKFDLKVTGFSSPGWTDRDDLPQVLKKLGFSYRADLHGPDESWGKVEAGITNVATNLVAEPGGVAYLEHLRARGLSDTEILADFRIKLKDRKYAVVYDHPYFAGVNELALVEEMICIARSQGFRVLSLGEIAKLVEQRFS